LLCCGLVHATEPSPVVKAEVPPPVKGVGLVLGGGGARGLAHIGVLEELEKLHIPIACIAGTSAGALVGGVYASGMPVLELEKQVVAADWNRLLTGVPNRKLLPYARKRDDFDNLMDVTLGVSKQGVLVPRALVGSHEIDVFLRLLTRDIDLDDYRHLPIPFQAVATDLLTGNAVEFKSGDLAIALRSSMAVPGVFDLVDYNGELLVDGMLVRNVPVQNVKGQCADTVIVVDVGTRLLERKDIRSLIDVAEQQSNILVRRNVDEQLAKLDSGDVVIQPDLTGFSSSSFSDAKAIIEQGRKAVQPLRERLAQFSVGEADYARWKQYVASRLPEGVETYNEIAVADTRYVPKDRIESFLKGPTPDEVLDQPELLKRLERLYATGDFDRVSYVLRDEDGKRVAEVMPLERTVGPNFLRAGLDFKLDSYGTANVAFLGNLQMNWMNSWAGQWRNKVRLGQDSEINTEWYQPISWSGLFLAASAQYGRKQLGIFSAPNTRLANIAIDNFGYELGGGWSLGALGEARLSWVDYRLTGEVTVGAPIDLGPESDTFRGPRAYLVLDQLDNARFPRSGYYLRVDYEHPRDRESNEYDLLSLESDAVGTFGKSTIRGSLRFAGNIRNGPTKLNIYTLGGFLNLSGYQTDELLGTRTVFARVMFYQQVVSLLPTLGSGMYLGASLEGGKVWNQLINGQDTNWISAGSAYLGFDTFLGPLFMAYGMAQGGRKAGYLYLGVNY
jgi:NTE family protein